MDPIETIDVTGDSSFVLGVEAQNRGYDLVHYLPQDLSLIGGEVIAHVRPAFSHIHITSPIRKTKMTSPFLHWARPCA